MPVTESQDVYDRVQILCNTAEDMATACSSILKLRSSLQTAHLMAALGLAQLQRVEELVDRSAGCFNGMRKNSAELKV
jgi:dTDP-4-amino-4,6-dideoxygalactose transaminase